MTVSLFNFHPSENHPLYKAFIRFETTVIRLLRISTTKFLYIRRYCLHVISTRDAIHTDRIALCSTITISAGEMIGRMQNSYLPAYLRMRANSARSKIAPPDSYIRNSSTSSERYEHNREQRCKTSRCYSMREAAIAVPVIQVAVNVTYGKSERSEL